MATPNTPANPIETAGLPLADRPPAAGNAEPARSGLYLLSAIIAGVAILAALLAVIAAGAGLTSLAAIAWWVFIASAGLWVGGTVYILSLSGRHLWRRLRRTNIYQSAS